MSENNNSISTGLTVFIAGTIAVVTAVVVLVMVIDLSERNRDATAIKRRDAYVASNPRAAKFLECRNAGFPDVYCIEATRE